MGSVFEQLHVHSNSEVFEDYMEMFGIWSMTTKDVKGGPYSLLKTSAYPYKPVSLPYPTVKQLLLNDVNWLVSNAKFLK